MACAIFLCPSEVLNIRTTSGKPSPFGYPASASHFFACSGLNLIPIPFSGGTCPNIPGHVKVDAGCCPPFVILSTRVFLSIAAENAFLTKGLSNGGLLALNP